MKKINLTWTILAVLCIAPAVRVFADDQAPAEKASIQRAYKLDRTIHVSLKYLLYLPKDYAKKPAWPLMLFLHGAGERGDNLNVVKKHGPPKLIEAGQDLPFIVVSPQCPKGKWWESLELATLLDEIVANYKVDQDRIYLTGLSMGGFGTWALATYQPDRFAAIVPICGGGDPAKIKLLAPHIPAWVFHGGKDPTVPLERSVQMVEAMRKYGGKVNFTIFPDAMHDSWTQAYENPYLFQWLLQQKRGQ